MTVDIPVLTDVLIVGAGPAGMMAGLCLTTFGMDTFHIDNKPEPTQAGKADGLQPRTLEVMRNIGAVLAEDEATDSPEAAPVLGDDITKRLLKLGVRIYEVSFWDPTPTSKLSRTRRAVHFPEFLDVQDDFTLLLHQGRTENTFLYEISERRKRLYGVEKASQGPYGGVHYNYSFVSCRLVEPNDNDELSKSHPVESIIEHTETKQRVTVRSKYLYGADGAKSSVRRSIAGGEVGDGEWNGKITMQGEATDIVWGVMDAQITTDFPDIEYLCTIHSHDAGSILIIPRERGLCRIYVQLRTTERDEDSHVERGQATKDIVIETAKRILDPYKVEFQQVPWFSVYQIGQRIASNYTLDDRVFICGDAAHTHSPKAGQGMNISMLDSHNWCWKINLVEKGLANRDVLLSSYEFERRGVAQKLLDFDRKYSSLFSGRGEKNKRNGSNGPLVDAEKFIDMFNQNVDITAGTGMTYIGGPLTALGEKFGAHPFNPPGCRLEAGRRLTPSKVKRAMDANVIRLQHGVKMNGSFRIHIFAGKLEYTKTNLDAYGRHLESEKSFFNRYRASKDISCSIIDGALCHKPRLESRALFKNPFFSLMTIVGSKGDSWEINDLPLVLQMYRDQIYIDAIPEPCASHNKYGIDPNKGAIVVVRPDGHIGAITNLDQEGWQAIDLYFGRFLLDLN